MNTKTKAAIVAGLACFGLVGCSSSTSGNVELEGVPIVIGEDVTTSPTPASPRTPAPLSTLIPSQTPTQTPVQTPTQAPTATPTPTPNEATSGQGSALANCAAITADQITIGDETGCTQIQNTYPQTFKTIFDRDLHTAICMWQEYSLDSDSYSDAYNLAWAEDQCLNSSPDPTPVPTESPEVESQALISCNAVTGGTLTISDESAPCADLVKVGTEVFLEIFDRDIPTATCMWREFSLDADDYSVEYNLEWAKIVCL